MLTQSQTPARIETPMSPLVRKVGKRIVTCFLAGVFAILPLVITIGVVIWVASFVRSFIGPNTLLGTRLRDLGIRIAGENSQVLAYVLGWLLVLLAIFALGVLMELGAKRLFSQL